MPVQPSYPGVYVQELPSSVHTITGVSTSIAVFIGRASQGPVNLPQLCLSFTDFDRTFGSDTTLSDMPRAVRLFFLNGGTKCYVTRIASLSGPIQAQQAMVTLNNTDNPPVPVLQAAAFSNKAKSYGTVGSTIRMSIDYNTQYPESTFNLTVFNYAKNSSGQLVMSNVETFTNLSMNPNDPKYVLTAVNNNSNLINLTNLKAPAVLVAPVAYSQAGRPITTDLPTFLAAHPSLNSFQMSLDGGTPVNINLSGATTVAGIETIISNAFPSTPVVTLVMSATTLPDGTALLTIKVTGASEIRITPASNSDLAGPLMLGTNQGGLEVSAYSTNRPAPNGIVFDIAHIPDFDSLKQSDISVLTINGTNINTGFTSNNLMYVVSATNNDGLRANFNAIATAINSPPVSVPGFNWTAQVWGSRLALIPTDGDENRINTIITAPKNIEPDPLLVPPKNYFFENIRYYSLGLSGKGAYQGSGQDGKDGGPPGNPDYASAFTVIDQNVDLFNLMVLPKDNDASATPIWKFYGPASVYCQQRRAVLLMDPPDAWTTVQNATDPFNGVNSLRIGLIKDFSALYYPNLTIADNNGNPYQVGPAGAIAGLMARIDANRGVWKAPAGTEADIRGIVGLQYRFNDSDNGQLNPAAINTLRIFPDGLVSWGARTMDGDDSFASQWKYIPVRRTALFIEESLYRGLKWVVFEPNDEPLWSSIRLNVGAFMHDLFRQGAFQGQKPQDAYFVKCDAETTTQNDIDLGIVNIIVGFAPLKPAEFVILYLQQMTGQIQV